MLTMHNANFYKLDASPSVFKTEYIASSHNQYDNAHIHIEARAVYVCFNRGTAENGEKLKRLFAGTIEQMLEAEMDEHLGYEKNSVLGSNSGNSRNGYGKKTIVSD